MLILAVETTGDLCSVAVRDGQGTLAERAFRHRMHLSERLIGEVDAVLQDAETTLQDVDGLVVGLGPGSFTGVRIGVTTVKTWADVLQKPVVGVNALEALAAGYAGVRFATIVPVVRARPGAVYAGFYREDGGRMRPIAEPQMLSVSDVAARIAEDSAGPYLVCGDGLARYRDALETVLEGLGIPVSFGTLEAPRAAVLAALGEARIAAGQTDDALGLTPLYLAPPPVDPRAEQMRG